MPAAPFRPLFRRLKLPVTIHAGEAGGAENVREAIERFGARRIGHGLRVLEDPRTLALAKAQGVVFEVCLTSEIQTGAAGSWRRHPGVALLRAGLAVTLNTDDPSICGTTLSEELRRARRAGLSAAEVAACLRRAEGAAFAA
jgi:adenosine deaminase